ncbi:MAG: alpha/beta hydrolase [Clostridiales bacterium]|nr:alpha/beta hydrolase [Clostridiales bacterium]
MVKKYRSRKAGEKIIETYDQLLKGWDCELIERDIETTYGTTHVIETGIKDGDPLVLFHGVGDDSALMWIFNAKELGKHYRIYAIDTMGGPGKSVPNENYNKSFDDTKWIDETLQGLNIDRAYFAGVSMGSYLVALYTIRRTDKVKKGICISGAVHSESKSGVIPPMFKIFLPEALFPNDKNVQKLIRKLCGSKYTVFTDDALIMDHYKSLLKGFNNAAMGYHKIEKTFTPEQIDILRTKVTFLVGNEDPFQKMGGREALLKNNMDAVFYEDAGHGLNHELHDEINSKMIELLSHA